MGTGVEDIRTEGVGQTLAAFIRPFVDPFITDNVPLSLGMNASFGVDTFGNEIPDRDRIFGKRGLSGAIEPSFMGQERKIREALTQDTDKYGFEIDPLERITQQLGLKVGRQSESDLRKELRSLRLGMARQRKILERAIIKINKDRQMPRDEKTSSKADIKERFASLRDRIRERITEVEKAIGKKRR